MPKGGDDEAELHRSAPYWECLQSSPCIVQYFIMALVRDARRQEGSWSTTHRQNSQYSIETLVKAPSRTLAPWRHSYGA